ncbi:MAG: hypothetical protein Kow00120_12890 [Anaerolineae bacterium]
MAWMGGVLAATLEEERVREEEEEMTRYTAEELEQGWEFKIVRSAYHAFGNPETLRAVVEQEARAGWVLVEKFDDARLRFRRPQSARERDHLLPQEFDPYRTSYGMSQSAVVGLMLGIVVALVLLGIVVVVVAV